jgi:hypothetical protein
MPQANLIKPATLVVEAIEKAESPYDEDYREPIGDPKRTTYKIKAQRWNVHRQIPAFSAIGVDEQVRCWFTIRQIDAEKLGWTPRRGDRCVKYGRFDIELYIINTEPMGHWEKGSTIMRLYCTDRRPAAAEPHKG